MPKPCLSSGERSQKSWSRWQELVFFGQAAPLSSPGGVAPTTPGAEDEEAELSTAQTFYRSLIIEQLIELGMSSLAQTAACQNLRLARWVSHFIKELGNNYTRPLGPQLCKRIHNKPTEQASPTCPSKGAKRLKRGNSESFQGGSEYGRRECNIQSSQRTARFPIITVCGSKERWLPEAHHQPVKAQHCRKRNTWPQRSYVIECLINRN